MSSNCLLPWQVALAMPFHHPMLSRYLASYLLLRQLPRARRVLLADCRDVIFQSDIFRTENWDVLTVSLEDRRGSIGGGEHGLQDETYDFVDEAGVRCRGVNAHWMRTVYGQQAAAVLRDKPISCAGVTFGPYSSVLSYLSRMSDHILRVTDRLTGMMGIDQAMHNFIVWGNECPKIAMRRNLDGPVFTAHGVPAAELRFDLNGNLLRSDGQPYAIIHQFDRLPELAQWCETKPWRKWSSCI